MRLSLDGPVSVASDVALPPQSEEALPVTTPDEPAPAPFMRPQWPVRRILLIAFLCLCVGSSIQLFTAYVYDRPDLDAISRRELQVGKLREYLDRRIPTGGALGCLNESRDDVACAELWYGLLPLYAKERRALGEAQDEYVVVLTEVGSEPKAALANYNREGDFAPGIYLVRRTR